MTDEKKPPEGQVPPQTPCSQPGRGPGGRFKPGQSGNPGGRPKKNRELAELAQAYMPTAIRYAALLGLRDSDGRVAMAAATFLRDTAMGRPAPTNLDLTEASDETLLAEVRRRAAVQEKK